MKVTRGKFLLLDYCDSSSPNVKVIAVFVVVAAVAGFAS